MMLHDRNYNTIKRRCQFGILHKLFAFSVYSFANLINRLIVNITRDIYNINIIPKDVEELIHFLRNVPRSSKFVRIFRTLVRRDRKNIFSTDLKYFRGPLPGCCRPYKLYPRYLTSETTMVNGAVNDGMDHTDDFVPVLAQTFSSSQIHIVSFPRRRQNPCHYFREHTIYHRCGRSF